MCYVVGKKIAIKRVFFKVIPYVCMYVHEQAITLCTLRDRAEKILGRGTAGPIWWNGLKVRSISIIRYVHTP